MIKITRKNFDIKTGEIYEILPFNEIFSDAKIRPIPSDSIIMEKKFRNCSAEIIETESGYYLRSYWTIIAYIDKKTKICYDALRVVYGYTATSSQHISKFIHDYKAIAHFAYVYSKYDD